MTANQKRVGKGFLSGAQRPALAAWVARGVISALVLLGTFALTSGVRVALNTARDDATNASAAMYTLLETGRALEAEITSAVRPAIERTEILARSPDLIQSLSSGNAAAQTAYLNARITTATEIDAIALFDSTGGITAINTTYADGRPIPKERIDRVLGANYSQRKVIQNCLRNNSSTRALEFQTHCDITPALFDSTGLSVAYSVPVIDPLGGAKLGVISSRLRFERLTAFIDDRAIAGGAARAYFVTDAGAYFSEAINSGREHPPVPANELREIVRSGPGEPEPKAATRRGDKYLAVFSVPGMRTIDGGGIHVLLVADRRWLTRGPRQDRLFQACAAGLIGALLLIVAALVHSGLLARRHRRSLEQASQANARLAGIVESSAEAIISDNIDGTTRSWNRGAEKIFGYTAAQAIGHSDDLLEPPDRRGEIARLRREVLNGASVEQFETRCRRGDGREIDVSLSMTLIRGPGGEITGISRIARDITAQKRVEQELREAHDQLENRVAQRTRELSQALASLQQQMDERMRAQESLRDSEERFRQLAENTDDVFWMMSAAGDRILYISPRYEQVWGRSCRELCEHPQARLDAIEPQDRQAVEKAWVGSLRGGEYAVEYRIRRPDGAVRWVRDRAFPVRDGDGKVYRIAGIAEDITARRAAAKQLKNAQDSAEAADHARSIVFDTALDAIVTIDASGAIIAWNLQAETMFRWDRTEVLGLRIDQTFIPEAHWAAHRREIENFLKTGNGALLFTVVELVAARRDGREFPVEVAITPAWADGQCTFTAFVRDITRRKKTEADLRQAMDAAETANRAKSEFLAKMSHEIRTPLNGVIGMSYLLLETALDQRQKRFAQLIKSSGESLLRLINDILDFSKIEARKLELESVGFDLCLLVEDVTDMLSMNAAEKGLSLACLTMADVPRYVRGDPQRVKQILVNLVNNAIKFTEKGSISTQLTLEGRSSQYVSLRFAVSDTGMGIPPDRMDRLFKSFSQVDSSTTRTHGGTGLGLAIAKQLAELMGGEIGVESTVGRGSTFWFTLQLAPEPHAPPTTPTGNSCPAGLRVLAVHENPMLREVLRGQLFSWQLETQTAQSGKEAMTMLLEAVKEARPFDVAIFDSQLSDITTLELASAVKSCPEIAATVLLIVLPADGGPELSTLRAAGFRGHLNSPVRQSRLYEAIANAMDLAADIAAPLENTSATIGSPQGRGANDAPRARILLAEDNRVNQIVSSEVLARHGYACDIVDNGAKAVAAASVGGYDLILMDCSMPEMDGFEATQQIRRVEQAGPQGATRHIPIIALTANAINGDRERCLAAGMDDYVSKPIEPDRLIHAIQTLLGKSTPAPAEPPKILAQGPDSPPEAPLLVAKTRPRPQVLTPHPWRSTPCSTAAWATPPPSA
jgi:PAS domain S-box-containing protein